ncbi:MAG TPA: hypothetical protein VJA21_23905 [Verrucomicrobiae bacterium]
MNQLTRFCLLSAALGVACVCGVSQTADAAAQKPGVVAWRAIGPGQFGAMFGIGISPHDSKIIVAGGDMGLAFMTRDGGQHWEMLGRSGAKEFANPGYRGVWAVCFDPRRPERIFIGSTHGLFRTTDGGRNWRLVLGGDADYVMSAIACDPKDSDIIYAGSGMGARMNVDWSRGKVWKSTNGGESWQEITPPGLTGRRNWVTIAADAQSPFTPGQGHSRVYLCGQGGLFVTEDAGQSWNSLARSLPGGEINLAREGPYDSGASTVVLAPGANQSRLFITLKARRAGDQLVGGVYRSDDGGKTWVESNRGLEKAVAYLARPQSEFPYSLLVGCRARPEVMYWANYPQGVFRTDDGGATWRPLLDLKTDYVRAPDFDGKEVDWLLRGHGGNFDRSYFNAYGPANGLSCSATDPDAVAYTDNAGLALSVDGGKGWTEPGFDYGEAYRPNQFGDRPPIRLTHKVRSRGLHLIVPTCVAVDPSDPKTIAIGHQDVGLVISRDGGNWWEWAWHGILEGEKNNIYTVLYDPAVRGRLWTGGGGWRGSGHVYQSDDSGRTFRRIGIPQSSLEAGQKERDLFLLDLALDPASPPEARTLYAGTSCGLFRTTNSGASWQAVSPGDVPSPRVKHLQVDPTRPARLYASVQAQAQSANGLYGSEDGGQHWKRLGEGKIGSVRSLSLCERTGTLYVLGDSQPAGGYFAHHTLWRSDDHGETWARLDERLAACVGVHPRDPDRVYLAAWAADVSREKVNVYRSADGGKSWTPIADNIPLTLGGEDNAVVFDRADPARFFVLHSSGAFEAIDPAPARKP